jgi:hypothetical protein
MKVSGFRVQGSEFRGSGFRDFNLNSEPAEPQNIEGRNF